MRKTERGFTLVELLVALMLFSLIALVATTMTASATRSFATSQTALSSLSEVETIRTLLGADLGQAARRPSLAADGKPMPAFTLTESGFVFVRRRSEAAVPELEKISWGLVDGQLLRQPFVTIDSGPPGDAVLIADGISSVSIRVADDNGWSSAWTPQDPDDLPRAVELTIMQRSAPPVTMKLMVAA